MSVEARFTRMILKVHFYRLYQHGYKKQRELQEKFSQFSARIPKGSDFEALTVGDVPAEWIRRSDSARERVILHFHGGAYYAGSIGTHRDFCAHLAQATGMPVLLLEYRLAPEHPYPAAVEDAATAYRWLLTQGFDPGSIVLSGDSAGGGLALATLVNLRSTGEPLPAAAVCISPWTDLTVSGDSIERNENLELMCKPAMLRQSAQMYAGKHDLKSALISPLFADLRDLPPVQIHVGSTETLLDDSVRFAERARLVGVDVDLHIWPDMFHVFPLVGYMPETKKALRMITEFINHKVGIQS